MKSAPPWLFIFNHGHDLANETIDHAVGLY